MNSEIENVNEETVTKSFKEKYCSKDLIDYLAIKRNKRAERKIKREEKKKGLK